MKKLFLNTLYFILITSSLGAISESDASTESDASSIEVRSLTAEFMDTYVWSTKKNAYLLTESQYNFTVQPSSADQEPIVRQGVDKRDGNRYLGVYDTKVSFSNSDNSRVVLVEAEISKDQRSMNVHLSENAKKAILNNSLLSEGINLPANKKANASHYICSIDQKQDTNLICVLNYSM